MKKAKIVHIITKMEFGGAQQNTLFTVSHLNPEQFDTFLLAGSGGELFDEASTFSGFHVVPDLVRAIRPIRDLKAVFQIKRILKHIKAEEPSHVPIIVHTHSSKAGILGRWAAKFAGISHIIHSVHGFGFHDYQHPLIKKAFIFLEQITSPITSYFIAVSSENIEKGVALNIFTRQKTRLIRSGIDIPFFQSPKISRGEMRKKLAISDAAPLVTMISCFKPQKAPLDFVRACAVIKKEVPDTRFLLVGDGVLRNAVEHEIRENDLGSSFSLAGWRRDVTEILHASDIFVLTSLWEGLPRVLPQSMCAGIPIVATSVDGTPEVVRDGSNGFLVQPGDIKGIVEKVLFLLKNPGKATEMGKKGLEMVMEFDIYKMVRDQEKLYEEILSSES